MTSAISRRAQLADAAITVLAGSGSRGLTHRAVDRAAGVPAGSTSYYFRTRSALLLAVAQRLAEVDTADVPPTDGPGDLDELADRTAGVLEHWLGAGRDRMLARWELALEATRRPDLRDALVAAGEGLRAMAVAALTAAGASDPERRGRDLVAYLDGLLFDQLAGAGRRRTSRADLRAAVRDLLRGVLDR